MPSKTQTERLAVSAVTDYVDATDCLRSYIPTNDKTPLWDGNVYVYDKEPDKNENLIGVVKTQVKGKVVDVFSKVERYSLPLNELRLYAAEGGLFFFVVEILKSDRRQRRIFYKPLTPVSIVNLIDIIKRKGTNSTTIRLSPLPNDYKVFEDEMVNFISDSRKQVSFVGQKPLTLAEAMASHSQLRAEFKIHGSQNLAMALTQQPLTIYQNTEYASIPVSDAVLIPKTTQVVDEIISIEDEIFFSSYTVVHELKTITCNFGDVLILRNPKESYKDSVDSIVVIRYPQTGTIQEARHKMRFLRAVYQNRGLTHGKEWYGFAIRSDEEWNQLFHDLEYSEDLYRDIETLWQQLQIPGTFCFEDFPGEELNKYLAMVQNVYRKVEGTPLSHTSTPRSTYSNVTAGPLNILVFHQYLYDDKYLSTDGFSRLVAKDDAGLLYPLLSVAIRSVLDIVFDNIHFKEQLAIYRKLLQNNPSFKMVIEQDAEELTRRAKGVKRPELKDSLKRFVKELGALIRQTPENN